MNVVGMPVQDLLDENKTHDCGGIGKENICVRIAAIADLPTRFGDFQIVSFWNNRDRQDHVAIVKGDICNKENVLVRLHSECLTGDALGSLRCDCRDQLTASLKMLGEMEEGVLLYMRQEGRGIGLVNKVRAYGLQDHGYDTVEANEALGFRDDERDYSIAAHMLGSLNVRSIRLLTNNPKKIHDLIEYGIEVKERIPLIMAVNEHNQFYLETKALKSGHLIDLNGKRRLEEQSDRPILEGMSEEQIAVIEGS